MSRRVYPRAMEVSQERYLAAHYGHGNIVYLDYWDSFDLVLNFRPSTDTRDWSVEVVEVRLVDGEWVRVGYPRCHSTYPSKRDRVEVQSVAV